jgi:YegS/Rv2252/BmrU family lipid kinase
MKSVCFIYNPTSGHEEIKYRIDSIEHTLKLNFEHVVMYPTKGERDATYYMLSNAHEFDVVIAAGGDGTIHEVVNGIAPHSKRPILGIIPSGTTNDIAASYGISNVLEEALSIIIEGHTEKVDIGKINERYFMYVCAFGAFTRVSYETDSHLKTILGHFAYVLNGITQIKNIKKYHLKLEFDNKYVESDFLIGLVSNSKSIAGMRHLLPDSKTNDGKFDIMFAEYKPFKMLGSMWDLLKRILVGFRSNTNNIETLVHEKTNEVLITASRPIRWNIDGEKGMRTNKVKIKSLKEHITLITPASSLD